MVLMSWVFFHQSSDRSLNHTPWMYTPSIDMLRKIWLNSACFSSSSIPSRLSCLLVFAEMSSCSELPACCIKSWGVQYRIIITFWCKQIVIPCKQVAIHVMQTTQQNNKPQFKRTITSHQSCIFWEIWLLRFTQYWALY